jgi:ribosomal protein S18 acetylase RimI-like enzyme
LPVVTPAELPTHQKPSSSTKETPAMDSAAARVETAGRTEGPPALPVKAATAADAERVTAVLTLAFSADPAVRWVYPDLQQYWSCWPDFVRAFGGRAFDHGTAEHTDGYAGAALWLPPGVHPDDDALVALLQRSVTEHDQEEVFAVLEQMGHFHPSEPHWYLAILGVDPHWQGRGHGSALLRHALARCDRDHAPAYLESSNPRNNPLYERHGFEVLGTIQVGASPPIWPMVRPPR